MDRHYTVSIGILENDPSIGKLGIEPSLPNISLSHLLRMMSSEKHLLGYMPLAQPASTEIEITQPSGALPHAALNTACMMVQEVLDRSGDTADFYNPILLKDSAPVCEQARQYYDDMVASTVKAMTAMA